MTKLWIDGDRRSQLWGLHQGYETLKRSWTQRTTIKQCLEPNRNLILGIGNEITRPVHLLQQFRQKKLHTRAKQMVCVFLSLYTVRKMLGLFKFWSESVVFRLERQKNSLSTVNCSWGTGRVHCHQSPKDTITNFWFTEWQHKRALQHQEMEFPAKKTHNTSTSPIKLSAEVPPSLEMMEIFNPVVS